MFWVCWNYWNRPAGKIPSSVLPSDRKFQSLRAPPQLENTDSKLETQNSELRQQKQAGTLCLLYYHTLAKENTLGLLLSWTKTDSKRERLQAELVCSVESLFLLVDRLIHSPLYHKNADIINTATGTARNQRQQRLFLNH